MLKLIQDLNRARSVIKDEDIDSIFDTIYPFTNEDLTHCLKYFNFSEKSCLTVLGSSDQALDMHLMGAKKITTFDINPLTYYYFYLKKAAMMSNLSKEEYINFFYRYGASNTKAFDYNTFSKIVPNLSGDNLEFWSKLCDEFSPISISRGLFSYDNSLKSDLPYMINYLNDNNYDILKNKIKDINIDFINTDIKNLEHYLNGSYDFMYFSNIMQYVNLMYPCNKLNFNTTSYVDMLKKYKQLMLNLASSLNENGNMIVNYFFDISSLNFPKFKELDRIFFEKEFKYNYFNSSYNENECTLVYTKKTTI